LTVSRIVPNIATEGSFLERRPRISRLLATSSVPDGGFGHFTRDLDGPPVIIGAAVRFIASVVSEHVMDICIRLAQRKPNWSTLKAWYLMPQSGRGQEIRPRAHPAFGAALGARSGPLIGQDPALLVFRLRASSATTWASAAVCRRTGADWLCGHEEMELSAIVEIRATDPLMTAVYALRHEVFVVEQASRKNLKSTKTTRPPLTLLHFLMATSLERCASCTMSAWPRSAGWRYRLRHGKKGSSET